MNDRARATPYWAGVIIVLAAASLAVWVLREGGSADTVTPAATDKMRMVEPRPAVSSPSDPRDPSEAPGDQPPPSSGAALPRAVDLEALRQKIPDNLYWQTDAPSSDPEVLRLRAEEKKSWETLRGLVVSNTASEAQIDQYYDHQKKVSEDYLQLSTLVLEEYGDDLPDPEAGAHELSVKLHAQRLREIPRHREEARARKLIQDQKREAWRKEQGR